MNFNKVILIGRLTRDPEVRTFSNGGKVAKFGFVVSFKKKNQQTGKWDDDPMFIDVDAFNQGDSGTLANMVEQYCRKGSLICIDGRLKLESWDDKTSGQKRSKHSIIANSIQLLEKKAEAESRQQQPAQQGGGYSESYSPGDNGDNGDNGDANDGIPF